MLKKTGIILATVATGLVGLSSLAFAADDVVDNEKAYVTEDNDTKSSEDNSQLIKQYNDCDFDQEQTGSNEILAAPPVGVPGVGEDAVDLDDQSQDGNCTNSGDNTPADLLPVLG